MRLQFIISIRLELPRQGVVSSNFKTVYAVLKFHTEIQQAGACEWLDRYSSEKTPNLRFIIPSEFT